MPAKRVFTCPSRLLRAVVVLALLVLSATALPAAAGAAAPGPAWDVTARTSPTYFSADQNGHNYYMVEVDNVGAKDSDGSPVKVAVNLPAGLTLVPGQLHAEGAEFCEEGPPLTCVASLIHPSGQVQMFVPVDVAPDAPSSVTAEVIVSGGGAPAASLEIPTTISSEAPPFAFGDFEGSLFDSSGAEEARAGSHPYAMRVRAHLNTVLVGSHVPPVESPRKITVDLPRGLVINPHGTSARCTEVQLETIDSESRPLCPDASVVGLAHTTIGLFGTTSSAADAVYNMVSPPGSPATFAFNAAEQGIFIHLQGRVRSDGDYGLSSVTEDITQYGLMSGVSVELWGDPSDPSHDFLRGKCLFNGGTVACPVPASNTPLLTMPSACSGPLDFGISANSWQNPGKFASASAQTADAAGNPVGVTGCDKLSYAPSNETIMSTDQAETGSGIDFNVDFPDNGLLDKEALAESMTEKAVVTLPEGVTINPSVGEGLGFCTPAQYAKEQTFSAEGEGCPNDSKIGNLQLTSPLVDEALDGSVYLAQQDNPETTEHGAENPFDTDIALYLVLRNTQLGVMVKQPLKVEPDPKTGQLVATLENIPQLPFGHFTFNFREGARAALVTPSRCGKYTTVGKFYPSSDPTHPKTVESSFEITKGVNGGPCPAGGVPPFHPDFQAGAINNRAGSFSPFDLDITRQDGEQDMTKFSSILPPGELGSLAGVAKCPDSAIAAAKGKTGRREEAEPSCPANSLIGHTIAGAGVGDALTYVPGNLYLGGPYHGDPLSVISITPGVAGPFDAGTIVVQLALTLNSKTAEVEVDGAASDPIPHILKGIVLKVRDLRVQVDRPNFTLNPTSCEEEKVRGTMFGAYLNVFDPSDDVPTPLQTRYQAADCQSLGFKPNLQLNLKGGTKRGGHPALKAIYTPRKGDANIKGLTVRLPHSAFLDQAHIKTICTRVQFAAGAGNGADCPAASKYGFVKAYTPLLDEPLEGPVFLRSSNHKLPDLLFALHGLVNVEVDVRIDSSHGGIRANLEDAPDANLSKVILHMQGAKKGLIINSKNLCSSTNKANVLATGHNGKQSSSKPVMKPQCGGKRKSKRHRR